MTPHQHEKLIQGAANAIFGLMLVLLAILCRLIAPAPSDGGIIVALLIAAGGVVCMTIAAIQLAGAITLGQDS